MISFIENFPKNLIGLTENKTKQKNLQDQVRMV
jgi:hypothetical protein